MKAAGELLDATDRWRDIARGVTDLDLFESIQELIEELEARVREMRDGASGCVKDRATRSARRDSSNCYRCRAFSSRDSLNIIKACCLRSLD
jgi:hypothetical protein